MPEGAIKDYYKGMSCYKGTLLETKNNLIIRILEGSSLQYSQTSRDGN